MNAFNIAQYLCETTSAANATGRVIITSLSNGQTLASQTAIASEILPLVFKDPKAVQAIVGNSAKTIQGVAQAAVWFGVIGAGIQITDTVLSFVNPNPVRSQCMESKEKLRTSI